MFKRSLASCMAVTALATAITTPANAYELTVQKDICTIRFSAEEIAFVSDQSSGESEDQIEISRKDARQSLGYAKFRIAEFEEYIAGLERALKNPALTPEEREDTRLRLKEFKTGIKTDYLMRDYLSDCANGKNHSQSESDAQAALSTPEGAPNGAGIGLIVGGVLLGVLGLIAAALPAIAPMLPAQIRNMLPI